MAKKQKIVVVGAGPVGSLAALYAAQRGHDVAVYELRPGESIPRSEWSTPDRPTLPIKAELLAAPLLPMFAFGIYVPIFKLVVLRSLRAAHAPLTSHVSP
jgi:choline dehydrogenase-like flavoprotein